MCEIKPRWWDKENNRMVYPGDRPYWISPWGFPVYSETKLDWDPLMPTGLKDKNGKEIYEGDIIKITYDTTFAENPFYVGVVKYGSDTDYPAFDLYPWIDCEMNALSWLKSESDESVISYEVIGNIYEHPHLLEAEHVGG